MTETVITRRIKTQSVRKRDRKDSLWQRLKARKWRKKCQREKISFRA